MLTPPPIGKFKRLNAGILVKCSTRVALNASQLNWLFFSNSIHFKVAFSIPAITCSFKVSTSVFPNYPVQKGDQWTIHNTLVSNYSFDVNSQFQLTDIDDNFYYIKSKSTLNTINQTDTSFKEVNGVSVRVVLNGNSDSEIKLDKKTGWIIECTTKQSLQGNTEIKETEQFKGGMKIPLKMTQSTTITN